ncbi:MAG: anaerobic ribonucleoside-triphosphate reductase activating protein [Bacteroidaceae bacterium]|nr:anaerobic ribonucleoside-triphosphate reductase activating protein [Bacteroidaceae bacterium]
MLKFVDTKEVFAEIPDEITLAISISGCPIRCKGCHSKYLWEDVGDELTVEVLSQMLESHVGVTCVCFMGGDNDPAEVNRLAAWTKQHSGMNIAWYSGRDEIADEIELCNFDYLKIGRYDAERGPLNTKGTNQILWRVRHADGKNELEDSTHRFWK